MVLARESENETKKRLQRFPGFKPDEILILQGYPIALQGTPLINVRLAVKSKTKVIPKEILHHLVLEAAPEIHRRMGHDVVFIERADVRSGQASSAPPEASGRNSDEPDSGTPHKYALIVLGILLGVVCLVAIIIIIVVFYRRKRKR